ncbi:6977_t:CDS:2 [Ambispora gerdemannii]|uniref:6977_t:CDS:1 n=1 Tax=Ambispora gerdemannii TaxID=144530 RepID=A0A9N8V2U0_9GLOM|nr:6977_t:CDS:2 [Ambispora gerdemannii]
MKEFPKDIIPKVDYALGVCTGTALIAVTGLLDGKSTTTNKIAYRWVTDQTSAGSNRVALDFVSDIYVEEAAQSIAIQSEYD